MNARTSAIPDVETRSTAAAPGAAPGAAPESPAASPKPVRSRRRRILPLLGLLVLAGGAAGGTWYWSVGRFLVSTDNAYVGGDIAVLSPRIEGDVTRILVSDNQAVEAGQPLIELERRDWQARRDQAAAALAEAEANIGTLAAQRAQALAQVSSAEAQVSSAEAQSATAEAERVRAVAECTTPPGNASARSIR